MKFDAVRLPEPLIEEMKNAPFALREAENCAYVATNGPSKEARIRKIKRRIRECEGMQGTEIMIANDLEKIEKLSSESAGERMLKVLQYETVLQFIQTLLKRVGEHASVTQICEWSSRNSPIIAQLLRLQVDESEKDNVLELVSDCLAKTVPPCNENLIHKYMGKQQIAEFTAARLLENCPVIFPHLVSKNPEEALEKATQQLLGQEYNNDVGEVAIAIIVQLNKVLRNILRYPSLRHG